ncbi:MAG TPA: circularly permuted type 2 ATP-grasp protein [Thermoleophilaceae bacterium]
MTPSLATSDDYAPSVTAVHDEALDADGEPRPLYAELLAWLDGADLDAVACRVEEHITEHGVAFRSGDDVEIFHVDPVPRLIARDEWSALERGISQRVRALAAFTADVYGERAIVRAGVVPERVIESADHFEPWLMGVELSPEPFGVAGLDIVRDADGRLMVLEDNLRTPSGLSYAAAARATLDAALDIPVPAGRLPADAGADLLIDVLRAAAPDAAGDPAIAVITDGPQSGAWYEHRDLARRLGVPLVQRRDLHVRGDRLYAWADDGRARELEVVYLRADEDRLRDEWGEPTWLAELLLGPLRAGRLAVVNPLGAGVADDKLAHAYVESMIGFYLGEQPLLASVPTYDLADPDQRRDALARLGELVVKPRSGQGGAGIVVCRHATSEDRERIAGEIERDPGSWIAQETITLSTHPTVCAGALEPRHVDLRAFAIGAGVVPGGLTRFARDRDALVVNSSQGGGAKDTWVL